MRSHLHAHIISEIVIFWKIKMMETMQILKAKFSHKESIENEQNIKSKYGTTAFSMVPVL